MREHYTIILCIVLAFILLFGLGSYLRTCYPMPSPFETTTTTTSMSSDTNEIEIDFPQYSVEKFNIPARIIYKNITDSQYVNTLLTKIDSLKKALNGNVTIVYALDTIHSQTSDTIRVVCDELNRSILFSMKPSPRQVQTITHTITNTIENTVVRRYGLGLNVGVAYTTKQEIVPAVSVGFNYIFY